LEDTFDELKDLAQFILLAALIVVLVNELKVLFATVMFVKEFGMDV